MTLTDDIVGRRCYRRRPFTSGDRRVRREIRHLEKRLDSVASDVADLKIDVAGPGTPVAEHSSDGAGLLSTLEANTNAFVELRLELAGLHRDMDVFHEDVVARIRALREDDSLRREMRAGFAQLRQLLKDHAATGDAADRHFATTLDDRDRRIRNLEGR